MRGSCLLYNGIPCIPSYLPQDAADSKNYEKEHNKEATDFSTDSRDEDDSDSNVKGMSGTKRGNFAFWLYADTNKAKRILSKGIPTRTTPLYVNNPDSKTLVDTLRGTKNSFFYFDIETDYENQNLLCFSFSFDGRTIYNVPILDYNYKWFYFDLHKVMQALAICIRDNITVAHNGHAFDFFVLAEKYGICIGESYDTMMAHHRCFPDVEKSLGHCISYWTWEPFHKDTDSESYRSLYDMNSKLAYCGRDVYGMFLVHKAIESFSVTIPGLVESIASAMKGIKPYLTSTMQGIRYNPEKIKSIISENDRLMEQYERVCKILIGEVGMSEVQTAVKGKAGYFCGSTKQQVKYFHDILGYPVLFKSEITGEASLGKKTLFKLQAKHDNPVIGLVNMYRTTQKESGALSFNPWKDDEGKIYPRVKDV